MTSKWPPGVVIWLVVVIVLVLIAGIGLFLAGGPFSHGPIFLTSSYIDKHLRLVFGPQFANVELVTNSKVYRGGLQSNPRLYISCKMSAKSFARFLKKRNLELLDLQGKPDFQGDTRSLLNYEMTSDFVRDFDPSLESAKWGLYIPDSIGEKLLIDESTSPTLLVHIQMRTLSKYEMETLGTVD